MWNLNVDNLFRANQKAIRAVFEAFATFGLSEHKFFSKDDALKLGKAALLPLTEK